MWNCDWEYENQETLKQWYEEKLAGIRPYSAVRKIICKGCGKTFTPSGRMRSTAPMPAASGLIARVLRIRQVTKLNTYPNRNGM